MASNWRKRLYVWYCAAAYLSFLLVFLGLASSAWTEKSTDAEISQFGLVSYCRHFTQELKHECGALQFRSAPAWLDASRILAGLSVVLLFAMTPVSAYLHFQDDRREDVLVFTIFGGVSVILGLLGAILYAAMRVSSDGELAWGFAVFVFGHLFALSTFLLLCALNRWPKRKVVVKPFYMS